MKTELGQKVDITQKPGNDRLNMNDEWAWLHYNYEEETATTPVLVNFSDQIQVINGSA